MPWTTLAVTGSAVPEGISMTTLNSALLSRGRIFTTTACGVEHGAAAANHATTILIRNSPAEGAVLDERD